MSMMKSAFIYISVVIMKSLKMNKVEENYAVWQWTNENNYRTLRYNADIWCRYCNGIMYSAKMHDKWVPYESKGQKNVRSFELRPVLFLPDSILNE